MKKLIFVIAVACLWGLPARAQQTTAPVYCNASAIMDVASDTKGVVALLTSPMIGGINVCGYALYAPGATTTMAAGLGYGTSTSGAAFFPLTPGWQLTSQTIAFIFPNPNGVMWVPPGNALELSASLAATLQAQVWFFEQYPGTH